MGEFQVRFVCCAAYLVTLEGKKIVHTKPSNTVETITVTRPMKVIAFICCTISTFLMILACGSSKWLVSDGFREGLFQQCINVGAPLPLPFNKNPITGCFRAHNAGYVRATAALIIIVCFTDLFGTILTSLGIRSTDPNKKYKYYSVAIYTLILCTITLLLALIIYPVSFSKELETEESLQSCKVYNGLVVKPMYGTVDFDQDGIMDHMDDDHDGDGIPDPVDFQLDVDPLEDYDDKMGDWDGELVMEFPMEWILMMMMMVFPMISMVTRTMMESRMMWMMTLTMMSYRTFMTWMMTMMESWT